MINPLKKEFLGGKNRLVVSFILALVAVGSLIFAVYFYTQIRDIKKNPQKVVQENAQMEVKKVVEKVSELILLPEGEEPTVATVADPEKLKSQPFFANAKIGDKLLIYNAAKKAILYDPAAHKIIEVAPLNIGGANQ